MSFLHPVSGLHHSSTKAVTLMTYLYALILTLTLSAITQAQIAWTSLNTERPDAYFNGVAFINEQKGFAVAGDGIVLYTENGGQSWGTKNLNTKVKLMRVRFLNENIGFICGEGGKLFKTTNGGNSWDSLSTGSARFFFDVAFYDENLGIVGGEGNTLLVTTDGGATWTQRDPRFNVNNVNGVVWLTNQIAVAVGNAGKISRTTNGGQSWQSQTGAGNNALYAVSAGNQNVVTAVGSNGMILQSREAGRNWKTMTAEIPIGSYIFQDVHHVDSNTAFVVGWNGMILRTTNGGANWLPQDLAIPQSLQAVDFVNENVGYTAGWAGTMYKTESGGFVVSVERPVSPFTTQLNPAYPNPIRNSFVTFSYGLNSATTIRITIHDVLGREVMTVFEGQRAAGTYDAIIPSTPLQEGLYFIRLSDGTQTMTQSFLVVK